MQALADCVIPKVSAQAISKYETDKMMPSSTVLVGLGKALGISLDFLLGGQIATLSGIEFRKRSRSSAQDRAQVEAIVIEKLENYLVIEEILELGPPDEPISNLVIDQVDSLETLDKMARNLRQEWMLGIDPIPGMATLLEDKGIKVIETDLPERVDGMACDVKRNDGKPDISVVVVSSRSNIERKRFTLAHELAHRIICATGNSSIGLEKAMNYFAGAFLVPGEHLVKEAGAERRGITYHELIRLKLFYGVSAAAMLMRLGQVGILSKNVIEYAFRSYARTWRADEPEPLGDGEGFGAFEQPQRFEQMVWRALGEQLISPVRAAQLLCLPLATVEAQIRGPRN